MTDKKLRYCGRDFSENEMDLIRRIIAKDPDLTRAQISREVCKVLNWYKPDGKLKEMSCRVAMLRMQDDGLFTLPRPKPTKRPVSIRSTPLTDPQPLFTIKAGKIPDLSIQLVQDKKQSTLYNEYIHRYHYLGYKPLTGAQLRYIIKSKGRYLAMLGFGASAWKVAPRDQFIGWNRQQRQKQLHLIVNNARYLILPWVKSKNLASKILSLICKRLPDDWQARYQYKPVLLETFIESQKFRGTCYKAANWVYLGQTKGRGRNDQVNQKPHLPIKDILIYPLTSSFRKTLCNCKDE